MNTENTNIIEILRSWVDANRLKLGAVGLGYALHQVLPPSPALEVFFSNLFVLLVAALIGLSLYEQIESRNEDEEEFENEQDL